MKKEIERLRAELAKTRLELKKAQYENIILTAQAELAKMHAEANRMKGPGGGMGGAMGIGLPPAPPAVPKTPNPPAPGYGERPGTPPPGKPDKNIPPGFGGPGAGGFPPGAFPPPMGAGPGAGGAPGLPGGGLPGNVKPGGIGGGGFGGIGGGGFAGIGGGGAQSGAPPPPGGIGGGGFQGFHPGGYIVPGAKGGSAPMAGAKAPANPLAISPDGRHAVMAKDKVVWMFDLRGGQGDAKVLFRSEGHSQPVVSVTFSPDGKWVISGSRDQVIILDAATGKEVRRLSLTPRQLSGVRTDPDGKRLIVNGIDGNEYRYDMATGQILEEKSVPK